MGPGRLAALERWLPYTVTIIDRFHCIPFTVPLVHIFHAAMQRHVMQILLVLKCIGITTV